MWGVKEKEEWLGRQEGLLFWISELGFSGLVGTQLSASESCISHRKLRSWAVDVRHYSKEKLHLLIEAFTKPIKSFQALRIILAYLISLWPFLLFWLHNKMNRISAWFCSPGALTQIMLKSNNFKALIDIIPCILSPGHARVQFLEK